MATQSGNPFYGNSRNGSMPIDSSTRSLALDNLIRRELKVSDPNNPQEIADALLTRYKDRPQALSIRREAEGVPFLPAAAPALPAQATTSSSAELQQAIDDVERDLKELTTNNILKDVTPELEGWAVAIRSAIQEGSNAARFGLDPRQRDKAFGIRRMLGDYARIARLIGALTPSMNTIYRKFAQSLDEVASVLLVMVGEALANIGFSGGRFLLQVPYSELQVRRDAAIYALRNLVGATQEAYAPNEWARGLDAYRRLFNVLEEQGQGDLRSLLLENELSRIMDELIQRSQHGNASGLRYLGSTSQLELQRVRRLIIVSSRLVSPESPPLNAFIQALQLFVDAFDSAGGCRLMRIARPPILFYGLYGTSGINVTENRLLQLVIQRGALAERLDCFMQCGCSADVVQCQVALDKILYDVDRAIDLYANGSQDFGDAEKRAAAYGYVIHFFRTNSQALNRCLLPDYISPTETLSLDNNDTLLVPTTPNISPLSTTIPEIDQILRDIQNQLWIFTSNTSEMSDLASELLRHSTTAYNELTRLTYWSNLTNVQQNSFNVWHRNIQHLSTKQSQRETYSINLDTEIVNLYKMSISAERSINRERPDIELPSTELLDSLLRVVGQEICIQRDMEQQWINLVQTMAPSCINQLSIFSLLSNILNCANEYIVGRHCGDYEYEPTLPPHYETSLDAIANRVRPSGGGRSRGRYPNP